MVIDSKHPAMQELMREIRGEGESSSSQRLRRALGLQKRFAETIAQLAQRFGEELALTYSCSSNRGERDPQRVTHRARAVKLRPITPMIDRTQHLSLWEPGEGVRMVDWLQPRYNIPVVWELPLFCHTPSETGKLRIVLEGRRGYEAPKRVYEGRLAYLDLAGLEERLFSTPTIEERRVHGRVMLQASLVLGTASVRQWLLERDALDTYEWLIRFQRQTA